MSTNANADANADANVNANVDGTEPTNEKGEGRRQVGWRWALCVALLSTGWKGGRRANHTATYTTSGKTERFCVGSWTDYFATGTHNLLCFHCCDEGTASVSVALNALL